MGSQSGYDDAYNAFISIMLSQGAAPAMNVSETPEGTWSRGRPIENLQD
jgi:hypothetical protein